MLRPLDTINLIVIHCAATPNGKAFDALDIDGWHKQRGFKRDPGYLGKQPIIGGAWPLRHIGYHYVITLDGTVEYGRRLEEVGAHVAGSNSRSIGICLVGTDRFTTAQWDALKALVQDLQNTYGGIKAVVGHRDLSPDKNGDGKIEPGEFIKTCPGFNVHDWLRGGMKPLAGHVSGVAWTSNTPESDDKAGSADIASAPDGRDTLKGTSAGARATQGAVAAAAGGLGMDNGGSDVLGFLALTQPTMADTAKPWWQSKTISAAIAMILVELAKLAGLDYDAVIAPYAGEITTILLSALAILGRATATKAIK